MTEHEPKLKPDATESRKLTNDDIVYVNGREMLRSVAEKLYELGQLSRANIKRTRTNSCIGTEYM